jgi:hypothetical protein
MDNKLADDRDPKHIEKRSEENVRSQRGQGEPTGVPIEPRESAPHGTVKEEPQKKSGKTVGYPAR